MNLPHTIVLHRFCPGRLPFLGRLGQQHQRSRPFISMVCHVSGSTDKRRDMNVVTTRMHDGHKVTLDRFLHDAGSIRKPRLFPYWQAIHVGSHHNQGTRTVFQNTDYARATNARRHVVPQCLHFVSHASRRFELNKRQLWVRVEVLEQRTKSLLVVRQNFSFERLKVGKKLRR